MKKKIRFISNPFSGSKRITNLKDQIQQYLDHALYEMDFRETEYAGHATILSKEARDQGYDCVVAIGGDGSINEVASPLLYADTQLAIIPTGSGNGFANGLGINRHDIPQAVSIINNRKSMLIDSCMLNDQFFLNVAGIGFDGRISYLVKHGRKRGLSMYLKHSLMESLNYQPVALDILIDDQHISGEFATVSIANGSYYGYNFAIAPEAKLSDGLLDVVLIKKTHKLNYFLSAYRFLNRTLHKSKYVELIKGKKVQINAHDDNLFYHIDGEGYTSADQLNISINPRSIKILTR